MSEQATATAPDDPFRTRREVCAQLRIGKTKFFELVASGELESVSIPTPTGTYRRRLVRQSVVDAFIADHTVTAP